MHATVTSGDFSVGRFTERINEYEFRRNEPVTDGAHVMTCVESGLMGKINENWVVKLTVCIV